MVEELLSFAVQKLWDLLSQEYEQFQGVKDQVTELQTDLNTLKSFLKDADAKKHTSAMVKNCVDVIKEIIFDAEDTIETFILKDELGKNGGVKKRIRRFACTIPERRAIALEIGGLSKRISKVIRDMQSFGVQQIIADVRDLQPLQQRLREMRQEFSTEYKNDLVGMEENVKKLVEYLVEENDVQVVSMTGMGGLGKTTLARQVFNHDKVKDKFDRVAWVCVSQVCERKNVWQTILQNFKPTEEEKILKMAEATLQRELFGLLETSKSLIVFDDIWKEEDWDRIKPIFPHTTGWNVLLTSRKESIARHGDRTYINFKPECLSDKDSWTLFQRIAMPRKDVSEWKKVDKEMEKMGKQMIKHCKGLPLAVRVLGGLLAAKYTLRDWKRISENITSHLLGITNFNDGDNNSFYHVLSLSFEELPGYLKYCFLYLAHFPEDYKIGVKNLSYFWAAEGIVWDKDGETIRDVGDIYIEELVKRNMVISERDNTTSRFETCCLHDLMREMCLSKAKEENFLQILGIGSPRAIFQSLRTSRRFVSHSPITLCYRRAMRNTKARSFIDLQRRLSWNFPSISFTRLQLLRVLHLPGGTFRGGKLPYIIGKLIHLRYLYLEGAWVFHIPSSLRNLKMLIYLNLNFEQGPTSMPDILMGMKELRYLALPGYMRKTKLRLSHLVNLETLINFSTDNCSLDDLRGMARLRILGIHITGESSLETLSASICGLKHLEDLDINYQGGKGTKEWRTLLDFSNLKQLTLSINGPLLSDEVQFPSRLTSLILVGCCLEKDPMPILEKLGQLKELNFRSDSFCGRRMVSSRGGFPQLQKLILFGLDELEEWIVEEGSMPLLHTLQINCCRKLLVFPDGMQFITSLKDLSVFCMGEQWEERLSKGGEDYYKVQHIPSVIFRVHWN